MILQVVLFWLVATLPGILVWPLVWKTFSGLPDRGYGLVRTAGILISGYLFWIFSTLGFIPNNPGGIISVLLLLGAVAGWHLLHNGKNIRDWMGSNSTLVISMEIVFLVSYGFWAFVRANNPELVATEKPMELAFLNSILKSPGFPPRDPWLSGYAISYYYFGYVIIAMLTRLSGLASGVTFNLANALWFGLGCAGSYSIVYNLLQEHKPWYRYLASTLGPLFVMISGNLEGFLEVLHQRRIFWNIQNGTLVSRFWQWLGIKQLVDPPMGEIGLLPDRYLWWWRASRVVNDIDLMGREVEVIDEFPFFSFILADNHPHVLALPFVLLAVGISLHLYNQRRIFRGKPSSQKYMLLLKKKIGLILLVLFLVTLLMTAAAGVSGGAATVFFIRRFLILLFCSAAVIFLGLYFLGTFPTGVSIREFGFVIVIFGGLAFLNTWDLPIYLTLLIGVLFYNFRGREPAVQLFGTGATGAAILLGSLILYVPWIISFQSQLGGILPNLIYPTRPVQFIIMFGISVVPLSIWLLHLGSRSITKRDWMKCIALGIAIPIFLWIVSLGISGIIGYFLVRNPDYIRELLSAMGAGNIEVLTRAIIDRRASAGWTSLFLGFFLSMLWLLIQKHMIGNHIRRDNDVRPFVFFLAAIAALLVLGAEFFYLRDLFGTRMNTVFKFYYAAWILWGLCTAWLIGSALIKRDLAERFIAAVGLLLLSLGLVYSFLAVWTRANEFSPAGGRTLDGTAYLQKSSSDYDAIQWINANLSVGTLVEAVGGSYTQYARISVHTGFPTVLGWPFHEYQWRGTLEYNGSRESDVQRLYETRSWEEAASILEDYNVEYVYLGALERQKYPQLYEQKFVNNLPVIYEDDFVAIYRVPAVEVP